MKQRRMSKQRLIDNFGEPDVDRRDVPYTWALWALCHRQDKLTPKQAEAVHLSYVAQLSQSEAAARSRYQPCSRESYRDRLHSARRALTIVFRAEARADGKGPSEVRRGANRGR